MFKAGIVGMGSISPMHIKPLQMLGIEIVAACDTDIKKAAVLGCKAYDNYEKMLSQSGFDILHICLPHHLHAPAAIAALKSGHHVLTEKPMATTVKDAEMMIQAAEESKKQLGVIFQNRYSPGAILIKQTLESGQLGEVQGGWFRVNWHRGENYYTEVDWRGKWETSGGGVVMTQSIHTFDMINYFLGSPVKADASIANRAHSSVEIEDVAEGVITYETAKISFHVNTYHPYNAPASLELICQNGNAALTGEDAEITFNNGKKLTAGADLEAQKQFGMKTYWGVSHIKQIQDFYQSLKQNTPVKINGEEALKTQKLVELVYESARV